MGYLATGRGDLKAHAKMTADRRQVRATEPLRRAIKLHMY